MASAAGILSSSTQYLSVFKYVKEQPRDPKGVSTGGQFASSDTGTSMSSDPTLARQAKEGIAAIEKLIPAAVTTADFSEVRGAWEDLSGDVQEQVRKYYEETTYGYKSTHLNTYELDHQVSIETEVKHRAAILVKAKHFLASAYRDVIDPKTLHHDETHLDEPGMTTLFVKDIRHPDGGPLTEKEREDIREAWHEYYDDAWNQTIEVYKGSDEYQARRAKEVLHSIDASWNMLDQQRRIELARELQDRGEISIDDTSQLQKEPAQWVTGVEKGAHDEDNYARTHALALRLIDMRTKELLKERGLDRREKFKVAEASDRPEENDLPDFYVEVDGKPLTSSSGDVVGGKTHAIAEEQGNAWAEVDQARRTNTLKIAEEVWTQWKQSSSQDLSLSLQLAAARELGGHHRLTPYEVEQAELSAQPYGGIPTLQAYVRAQWEVTQTIMQKAGEDRIKVYRGLMLDGADVKATKHELVDPSGLSLQKPMNVRVEQHGTRETVALDFNGEYLTVEKNRLRTPYEWRDVDPAVKQQVREAWEKNVREVLADQQKTHPNDSSYTFEKGMRLFEKMSDRNKREFLDDSRRDGSVPLAPFESTDEAVNRLIEDYARGKRTVYTKLPDLSLKRGGAQSTTGTRDVANDWGGVGDLPPDPERVVIRIEAPPTSALSLPVYGENEQSEHETVVLGSPDHWLWDAWHGRAPDITTVPIHTTASKAESKKLVIDLQAADRGKPHWLSRSFGQSSAKYDRVFKKAPLPIDTKTFDESKVIRDPKGTSTGGQFASSGHAGVATPDPTLAKEAAAGIAAVEKLIPEALRTADFSDTGESTEWSELSQDAQSETYDKWTQDAYDDVQVDTSQLRKDAERDLRQDNQEVLDEAHGDTLNAFKILHFTDDDPALDVGGEGFLLRKTLDPDTLDYGDGDDHDGYVALNVDALRFMNGDKLSEVEQQRVVDEWDERYARAMRNALEKVTESDSFREQVSEMESDAIHEQWINMSDAEKFNAANDYSIAKTRQVDPREPDTWTTGVEKGDHTDDDYARTHALALRLTEMRTDEIRKERGLLEPTPRPTYTISDSGNATPAVASGNYVAKDSTGRVIAWATTKEATRSQAERWVTDQTTLASRVSSETMISGLWDQWKVSSSKGTSLSLQLAAARELGGVHRLTPDEVQQAEKEAARYGGIATLQAYVRAQWEVTQTVMKKAGEDRIKVYRGLMLAGDDVDATRHELVDKFGKPPAPPTNVTASINPPTGKPIVSFDFAGEHFVVEKQPKVPFKSILEVGDGRTLESDDEAVQRRIKTFVEESQQRGMTYGNAFIKLPDLSLKRAGAQSTTGTRQVANDWGGVGDLPPNPKRVVLRVEAPATSAFSLPVYGANEQSEHETVVVGTQDHWLWDAWMFKAPDFESQNVSVVTHKADTVPLVIDLQAEDRGKPHWLSGSFVQSVAPPPGLGGLTRKFDPALHPKGPDGRFIEASAPRVFNRPSDISERTGGWPGDPIRYGWKDPKTGETTGELLTGEPLSREQLPETLYHVTTNAPAVESSGVLLGQLGDTGLGGGQKSGVSFTTSREDAVVIQRELRRAVEIARGEVDADTFTRYAREDEQSAGLPEGSLTYAAGQAQQTWEGNKFTVDKEYVAGEGYTRPRTPEEQERIRRSIFKDAFNSYLWARETAAEKAAGQPVQSLKNPILFGRQEHLAKLNPEHIQILEVSPSQIPQDALVTTGSDKFLHEVRAYSDVPVRRRKYESVFKWSVNQLRDEQGRFSKSGTTAAATEVEPETCEPGEPGMCFANANKWNARHGMDTDRVVHGKVTNAEGKTFDHAWIERENGTVVDPTTGVVLLKEKYYALLHAKSESSYTSREAVRNQIKARHHGPWTPEELGVKKFEDAQHPRDAKGKFVTLYHGTRAGSVESILKEGIRPDKTGVVFASESRAEAQRFAEGLDYPAPTDAAVIEIHAPRSAFFFEKPLTPGKKNPPGTRTARFPKAVPPEWLTTVRKYDQVFKYNMVHDAIGRFASAVEGVMLGPLTKEMQRRVDAAEQYGVKAISKGTSAADMKAEPLPPTLAAAEDRIRMEPREHMFMVQDGAPVGVFGDDDAHHVRFHDDMPSLKDMVVTHNHPSGFGLSNQDGVAAAKHNMLEMRAVGEHGTYSIRRTGSEWPKDFYDHIYRVHEDVMDELSTLVNDNTITAAEANRRHHIAVYEQLQREVGGFVHTFEPRAVSKFEFVFKYSPTQPRGEKGTSTGGRWVKGEGGKEYLVGEDQQTDLPDAPLVGRTFTSEEGYQWHEQGPVAEWAKQLPYADAHVLDDYSGFGYHSINDLRRETFEPRTISQFVRPATPEEIAKEGTFQITDEYLKQFRHPFGRGAKDWTPDDPLDRVVDEQGNYVGHVVHDVFFTNPAGEKVEYSVQRTGPNLEELADVRKRADHIDKVIAEQGYVLPEAIQVERGAYLPGVTYEDLQKLVEDGEVLTEKGFTSTMLGEAEGRARSYPISGKSESIYNRFPNQSISANWREEGSAIRFHIVLPAGTKVAPIEPVRRMEHVFPRIPDPNPRPPDIEAQYWTMRDFTAEPTSDPKNLQDKRTRSESEILLGSGAKFKVHKVQHGATVLSGDPTLGPTEVIEVWLEYIGGGSSDGRARH